MYKMILAGNPDIELPVDTIQYTLNINKKASLSLSIPNAVDYGSLITERINNNLIFYYNENILITCKISSINISKSPTSNKLSITGNSENNLFQEYDTINGDDIINFYSLNDGKASFQTNVENISYVPGVKLLYDEIIYNISEVSFSLSGSSMPSWTLTEGGLMTEPECTQTIYDGIQISDTMSNGYCYEVYNPDPLYSCSVFFVHGYNLIVANWNQDYLTSKYYNFELTETSTVRFEITGSFINRATDINVTCNNNQRSYGFLATIALGKLRAFQDYTGYEIDEFVSNEIKEIELTAGVYTLILVNVQKVYEDSIDYTIDYNIIS